ncbi:hypothetical protein WR25_00179 isoform J [Diploscapter pachys]|uniref:Sulfide:quinone oxidoreductase, mitochondrial n=1 Tax=Diploscapter pachys TaxID=2018661 RepID=A0A2A2JLK4_9BILA|nr:hypothetical protein WR25_00179 isoform D [Diploscapter pachys]PAV62570.1 hypothetical protein WR25_00179 isoform J [Diploscapter pachys]
MGVDPGAGATVNSAAAAGNDDGKIRREFFLSFRLEIGRDDQPPFDVKKIENIRSGVKFDTHYEIIRSLGDGKFGKVYQVVEKSTGQEFAAKFIRIRKEADRTEVEREVGILTQLRHPRIAQIYDAFYTNDGNVCLIMEIVKGGELFDRVADETYILSETAVGMIVCQLCEAMGYIHQQNIIHLDIKPENIMMCDIRGNRIKLIDFGLARYFDGSQELKYMAGTPEFAAPEVIKFEPLSYHTDMWSVGVITYILLSGYSPFLGDNLGETYCNVEKGVWSFTEEFDAVSAEAKDFIAKLLMYEPSKRMLPDACLEHPWLAAYRKKAQNNKILEQSCLEGEPIDNQKMRRYNANRKLRKVVIYVKFLIELNRLRNSLRSRMSENGKKFFEPLLKMGDEKERKIALVLESIKPKEDPASCVNAEEPKIKKKKKVKRMTVKDKDINENDKSAPIVKKKLIKKGDSTSESASKLTLKSDSDVEGTANKKAAVKSVNDSATESLKPKPVAKSLLDLKEAGTEVGGLKKISTSLETLVEKPLKKKKLMPQNEETAQEKQPSSALPPKPPSRSEKAASPTKGSVEDLHKKVTSRPASPEKRSLLTIPIENYVAGSNSANEPSKKKSEKAESSDSTKENRLGSKPERQGAMKKKSKIGSDETLNASAVSTSKENLTQPKSSLISERLGKLANLNQEAAPLKFNVVAAVKPKDSTEEASKESQSKSGGSTLLTLTAERKSTTTTATTTKTQQKVSSSEKKVQHQSEDKKVEAVEKKSSVHDKTKVSQVTTKTEETGEQQKGNVSVKKFTVTEDSIKSRLEKTRAEAQKKPMQTEVVKLQSSVTDSHLQKVQMEEKTKDKGAALKKVSLTGSKDKSIKMAGQVEAEITPHKLSMKRAELAGIQKVTTRAGIGENDKDNSKSKTSKIAFKVSTDGEKPSSSNGHLAVLTKLSSEEKKKAVHFNETARQRDRLPPINQTDNSPANTMHIFNKTYSLTQSPGGLQKMKSESNVLQRMAPSFRTKMGALQSIEEGGEPIGFNPRRERKSLAEELLRESSVPPVLNQVDEEFSFDNLKNALLRRMSAGGSPESTKAKSPIRIPSTKSLKDRMQHYEQLSAPSSHFRVLVVGGGAAGCGAHQKFARILGENQVGIVEPNKIHYYQPGFSLIGGGLMKMDECIRDESTFIHPKAKWIQDRVDAFKPESNSVILGNGDAVTYDFLVIATGCRLRYDKIKGLPEGLDAPGVCSNYSPSYCEKTYREVMQFKSGNCVFTFPNGPIKCAGAPQKAAYIPDSLLRQRGVRQQAKMFYVTSLPKVDYIVHLKLKQSCVFSQLFGVERYAGPLYEVAKKKDIEVKTRMNLIEVDTAKKMATFEHLNEDAAPNGQTSQIEYSLLHVAPPCSSVESLMNCKSLTDANGWLDVHPETLQSKKFPNVFGAGDCMNTPNAKTAAAVSGQLGTLGKNLGALLQGKSLDAKYDGYASCPLVVSTNQVILAEFTPKGPLETTPLDQRKPSYISYLGKRYFMPWLYWQLLVKGYWNGPATIRRLMHFGFKKCITSLDAPILLGVIILTILATVCTIYCVIPHIPFLAKFSPSSPAAGNSANEGGSPTTNKLSHPQLTLTSTPLMPEEADHFAPKEIAFEELEPDFKLLGTGTFGMVFKTVWRKPSRNLQVAVKILNRASYDEVLKEAGIMNDLRHHNILRVFGMSKGADGCPMIITPFIQKGSLLKYLQDKVCSI